MRRASSEEDCREQTRIAYESRVLPRHAHCPHARSTAGPGRGRAYPELARVCGWVGGATGIDDGRRVRTYVFSIRVRLRGHAPTCSLRVSRQLNLACHIRAVEGTL